MANKCAVNTSRWDEDELVTLLTDYTVSEQNIQSTQKPVETQYNETEFRTRVNQFTLKRAELNNRTISTATKNLIWGILDNKDKVLF